jgi:hypothetical protein
MQARWDVLLLSEERSYLGRHLRCQTLTTKRTPLAIQLVCCPIRLVPCDNFDGFAAIQVGFNKNDTSCCTYQSLSTRVALNSEPPAEPEPNLEVKVNSRFIQPNLDFSRTSTTRRRFDPAARCQGVSWVVKGAGLSSMRNLPDDRYQWAEISLLDQPNLLLIFGGAADSSSWSSSLKIATER